MRKDYHIHPAILQNPERFHAFADKAIQQGIKELCVTDHMPLHCSAARDRIPHGQVAIYCAKVREMAEWYKPVLSIKLGIEIDYHPSIVDEIEAVLSAGSFDFILGSSHLHVIKEKEIFGGSITRSEYVRAMFENTINAAQSGYFHAIAHLDMFRWIFSQNNRYPLVDDGYTIRSHASLIDETLCAIHESGLRLEINSHFAGQTGNLLDTYPQVEIVTHAIEKGISFSYGSDAHRPECVGEYLTELSIHPIYGRAISLWENT